MNARSADNDASRVLRVETDEDVAALWFHLTEDHGMSLTSLHGDPFLMHGAAAAFGLCDRTYERVIPPATTDGAS